MHLHVIVNIGYIWGYCDIGRVFFMGSIVFGDCGVAGRSWYELCLVWSVSGRVFGSGGFFVQQFIPLAR